MSTQNSSSRSEPQYSPTLAPNRAAPVCRLVLGTAQFGLSYGVANSGGKISRAGASAILQAAWAAGVRAIDTAVSYGDCESRLGELGVRSWQVITKLPPLPQEVQDVCGWVAQEVRRSQARLRVDSLDGVLLHHPSQLHTGRGRALYESLMAVRDSGRVQRIGISIYAPSELDALPPWMRFDVVQAPWNVLDQRMTRSGWAERLMADGTEFHARSLFLQGLLLMSAQSRPAYFSRWPHLFSAWDAWLAESRLSPLQACLLYALATPFISRLVVGVDSATQLRDILSVLSAARNVPELPQRLFTEDTALLNPALWRNN